MSAPTDPLLGVTLNGRYKILDEVGAGGAGKVYRALQLQLDREVAVKVVRPDVAEQSREELEARFFREASLAGRLSHPNVVQTFDYGTTQDGRQFVVMELLRGRTLKEAVHGGQIEAIECARLMAGIAHGLHHAHSKGMVHRDVKSSNIFLVEGDYGIELPKLLDFGLVKSVKRELDVTHTPTYLGTPLYMSPEQARGELEIDARSDIYSLGCLMYRCLSGGMPFRADSAMATALMHISDPYPPMRNILGAPDIDPELEAVVRRAMAKKREDRWPDAQAMASALDQWRSRAIAAPVSASQPPSKGNISVISAILGTVGILGALAILGVIGLAAIMVGVFYMGSPLPPPNASVVNAPVAVQAQPPAPSPAPTPVPGNVPVHVGPPDLLAGSGPASIAPPDPIVAKPPAQDAAPKPVAKPPLPAPAPPKPAPASAFEPVEVDGVVFLSLAHLKGALKFTNQADRDALLAAGVSEYTVDTVIDNRPYHTLQRFGWTRGIGPKTVQAIAEHTQ